MKESDVDDFHWCILTFFTFFVPKIVWVKITLNDFLDTLLAKDIQSPYFIHVAYVFPIAVNFSSNYIALLFVIKLFYSCIPLKLFLLVRWKVFNIWAEPRPVWSIPKVPDVFCVWNIHFVSCLPCQIRLILLFPVKDILKLLVITSISYQVSMTEIETCGISCCLYRFF